MKSLEQAIQAAQRAARAPEPAHTGCAVSPLNAYSKVSNEPSRNEELFPAAPRKVTEGVAPRQSRSTPSPPKYKRRAMSMVDLIHGDPCDPSTTHEAIEALVRIVDAEGAHR